MIPKRVTLENFLSFGPKTVIEFADDEPLWVVGGPNGVGKSAVFDAITFCLFGAHRGGSREVEPLVRHGANGFGVCVEFEFNGTDYRVARGRTGKPVQSVHRRAGDDWQAVPNIANARDVTAWAEHTLGLGADAFAASVLLRQGQADRIVSVGPTERMAILKKIIGAERYEELGRAVRDASRKAAARRDELTDRRDALPTTSDEEVQAAAVAKADAEASRAVAEQAVTAAAERVQHARRHQGITAEQVELNRKLAAADARSVDAEAIRRDHARLAELATVLPPLAKLVPLRDGLPATERERDEAAARLAAAAGEREAASSQLEAQRLAAARHRQQAADLAADVTQLRNEVAGLQTAVTNAEQLAKLDAELAAFEPDLDARDVEAVAASEHATAADQSARSELAAAKALLVQRQAEADEFTGVESGARCSRCGQTVSADHAEHERARLDGLIRDLTGRVEAAGRTARDSAAAVRTANERRKALAARVKERDRLVTRRDEQAKLGVSADVTGLRATAQARLDTIAAREADQTTERAKHATAEAEVKRLQAEHDRQAAEVSRLDPLVAKLGQKLAADRAAVEALAGSLPPGRADATAAELTAWQAEQRHLTAAGVADRFRELEQDFAQRDVWQSRLTTLTTDLTDVPADARVPVADAERHHTAAVAARTQADAAFQTARDAHAERVRRADELARVVADLAAAEQTARVHAKLDTHLGNAGLQRELVRRAEAAIVGYADETAGKLSDGELAVSLAGEADGDKALDLLVRVGDDPHPTPVAYLSGSQKFRVAVAVALGIGRFATGGARPLESVIIDEGFGSLDRDGLRAAADELTRLRGCLRRIVLVSHQEEFADRFPAVVRLERGEAGTTATAVRR